MSIAVNAVPTPYIHVAVKRRKTTWYSVRDGNWSDPLTWESNASRRWAYPGQNIAVPVFPQVGDDVYVNHSIVYDISYLFTITVNNLYISGAFSLDNSVSARMLNVNGDLKVTGSLNISPISQPFTINLFGVNNFINSFTSNSKGIVSYARLGDQNIMDLAYGGLTLTGSGTKYPSNNISTTGNLVITKGVTLPLTGYNMSITGTTSNLGGIIRKLDTGNILFVGSYTDTNFGGTIDFSGNPNVEMRGGIASWNNVNFTSGTGTWSFTTNSQSLFIVNKMYLFNGTIIVSGAITVTLLYRNVNNFSAEGMQINNSIDGTVSGSIFVNNGNMVFNTGGLSPMATAGVFTIGSTSCMGYISSTPITLPFTNYQSLFINNAGVKTLSGNTTIVNNLFIGALGNSASGAFLEASTYNMTIGAVIYAANAGYDLRIIKSGAGSIIFAGAVTLGNGNFLALDFSGNPTVEFRNGLSITNSTGINSGTGQWSFTTNNQSIALISGALSTIGAPVLISGTITLSLISSGTFPTGTLTLTGILTGDNSASVFDNRFSLNYQNATAPMATGKLYCNQAANTFTYGATGNQDIQVPSDPTSGYQNLTLNGSGAKKLLGNVSVKGTYTLTAPATLNSNGFSLTNP
jgi:hypothetical protein